MFLDTARRFGFPEVFASFLKLFDSSLHAETARVEQRLECGSPAAAFPAPTSAPITIGRPASARTDSRRKPRIVCALQGFATFCPLLHLYM